MGWFACGRAEGGAEVEALVGWLVVDSGVGRLTRDMHTYIHTYLHGGAGKNKHHVRLRRMIENT